MNSVIIWGAGKNLQTVFDSINLCNSKILAIIDNCENKQKQKWMGIEIYSSKIIQDIEFDYIIISPFRYEDIYKECLSLGVDDKKIIIFWNNAEKYDFLVKYPKENYLLKKENEELKLKLQNYRFELGLEPTPVIAESGELLKKMLFDKSSLCRFGDGEFEMMRMKERPWFQNCNIELAKRLKEVLASRNDKINIAIANNYSSLERYTDISANNIRKYLSGGTREFHMKLIDLDRKYYDGYVTRPYLIYKNKDFCKEIFGLWKEIFKNRNLLVVEGKYSRFGVNNDFLSSASSIKRILCPAQNAYNIYSDIKKTVLNYINQNDLVLISLGPTATILAFDLAKEGCQAIDIGQVDNEYEWYLRQSDRQIPIAGKGIAETSDGRIPKDEIDLSQYNSECLAIIE